MGNISWVHSPEQVQGKISAPFCNNPEYYINATSLQKSIVTVMLIGRHQKQNYTSSLYKVTRNLVKMQAQQLTKIEATWASRNEHLNPSIFTSLTYRAICYSLYCSNRFNMKFKKTNL